MSKDVDLKRIVAVHAIIAYPSLDEVDDRSGKYSALFLVDPDDSKSGLAALKKLIADHSEAVLGKRKIPKGSHHPLGRCDDVKPDGTVRFKHSFFTAHPDWVAFRAKSNFQPSCVAGASQTSVEPEEIRGGAEVVVEIQAYGYKNQSSGVALSLGGVWQINPPEVAIERGGASGSSFKKMDASKFDFKTPFNNDDEDD